MADNNSSAPLKTAEGAGHDLPKPALWRDPAGIRGYAADPGQGPWFTPDQMRSYASQAVAAQAAPAAVRPQLIADASRLSYVADQIRALEPVGSESDVYLTEVSQVLKDCVDSMSTPALPATEDSSAGDLAEARMNYTEAYAGAREDLSIWKRRALEAERDLRTERETSARLVAAINAENGPSHLGEAVALEQAEPLIVPLNEHGIAPCPLCGSKSKHVKSGESGGHRILCWSDTCECSSGYFFDKEAAISSWNSRTTEGK